MSTVAGRMAIGALVTCAAAAQPAPIPGWFLAGKNPGAYVIALDHETTHGGSASAILRCAQKRCSEFATLMQTIRADAYLGHRICLSAWVKGTEDDGPRLWMRVDGEAGQ